MIQNKNTIYQKIVAIFLIVAIVVSNLSLSSFAKPDANMVFFDLSLDNVIINQDTYSGKVYVFDGGQYTETQVSGAHSAENHYYVFQSNGDNRGYIQVENDAITNVEYPQYTSMSNWGESIKQETNLDTVVAAWESAVAGKRTPTENRIDVSGASSYHVTIDDIWSSYQNNSAYRQLGGVSYNPSSGGEMTLSFSGNNYVQNIYYSSQDQLNCQFTISGNDVKDSLTVIDSAKANYTAAIGGSETMESAVGMTITSGYVYAGVYGSACSTAIGGGANGICDINITGGVVTGVNSSNGTAIGGGYAGGGRGGKAYVHISDGQVYAYNSGNGAAIGGGGSNGSTGGDAIVTISGGQVEAANNGAGVSIGGGIGAGSVIGTTEISIYTQATVNADKMDSLNWADFYDTDGTTKLFRLYVAKGKPISGPGYKVEEICYWLNESNEAWSGTLNASGQKFVKHNIHTDTIYFDLSLGNVEFKDNRYSGYIYVGSSSENCVKARVVSEHKSTNKYYVFQSNGSANRGYIKEDSNNTQVVLPTYTEIENWGETVKQETSPSQVVQKWQEQAAQTGRTSTPYRIAVEGDGFYDIKMADIWSSFIEASSVRLTGGISFIPEKNSTTYITFIGNNRLENIHFCGKYPYNEKTGLGTKLSIGGATENDTLTVVATTAGNNKYDSAIGGSDQQDATQTIELRSGYIYAGTHESDQATAIGGGANGQADIRITGGVITGVSYSNGAAIGGGFGGGSGAGAGTVTITDGNVFAYNIGGRGAAIGGSGGNGGAGSDGTVYVYGGEVYAQATGTHSVAIGGGTSQSGAVGKGTLEIYGGKVTAISGNNIDNRSVGGAIDKNGSSQTSYISTIPEALVAETGNLNHITYKADGTAIKEFFCSGTQTPYLQYPSKDGYLGGWMTENGNNWSSVITQNETVYIAGYYAANDTNVICFDLALGNVTIDGATYSGKIYDQETASAVIVEGEHTDDLQYYIYQSTEANRAETGFDGAGNIDFPEYERVENWSSIVTNNSNVEEVIRLWKEKATQQHRTLTENGISVSGNAKYNITIQDVWAVYTFTKHSNYKNIKDVSLGFAPANGGELFLTFKGDNRLDNILYQGKANTNALTISGFDANGTDTLTVAATNKGGNWWCSAIGSDDGVGAAHNINIKNGVVFAGTTRWDNATAIGGGGNGYGKVNISGNNTVVTAVASTTGTAIGGGIGYQQQGGEGEISISQGCKVYAYNHGVYLRSNKTGFEGDHAIPVVAIGGGSSIESTGSKGIVKISGGEVFAQSVGGTAIGGGGSASNTGGVADVEITGGNVTAISTKGTVHGTIRYDWPDDNDFSSTSANMGAGVSIGGGTGYSAGGFAELRISGDAVVNTGSIGGGDCTTEGPLGYAKVTIEGGITQGQVIMQETGKEGEYCSFTMTGGILDNTHHKNSSSGDFTADGYTYHFVEEDGGAVCMKDTHGTTKITGGYIQNCRGEEGGAIYMSGGTFTMLGGIIQDCVATKNGGAVYLGGDNEDNIIVDVLSGVFLSNTAKGNGGALAVVGKAEGSQQIKVTVGVNKAHFDAQGNRVPCEHGEEDVFECPVFEKNTSSAAGGSIYVTGNTSTVLNIYCMNESESSASANDGLCDFMKMEGGKVTITTANKTGGSTENYYHGNTKIENGIYVTGGQMDLQGDMINPSIADVITVDITKEGDYFSDNRTNSTEKQYYKLIYFENFKDASGNLTTGQYKLISIERGHKEIISGNIYDHPGYTIAGWNTDPDGKHDYPQKDSDDHTGWYEVGGQYVFDGNPIGDLTIYAIWKANGYIVVYDPNVPAGEQHTGTMEQESFTYDQATKLAKNQYGRPGYLFAGWSTKPNGPVEYADQEEVTNLTKEKGETVKLYAQWTQCNHKPEEHEYTYSTVDGGKTLKRTCSCQIYSETITLVAEDAVYDTQSHPTKLQCSSSWTTEIQYKKGAELINSAPINAGTYTASITENGYTASVSYTIEKAEQPAPEKPIFDTDLDGQTSKLSVKPVGESPLAGQPGYDAKAEYQVVYYDVNGNKHATEWREGLQNGGDYAAIFDLGIALTNYYIYARYGEGTNYKESAATVADSIYFFAGDVEVEVHCGEGIVYTVEEASRENDAVNGLTLHLEVLDNYFFPKEYEVAIQTIKEGSNASADLTTIEALKTYKIEHIPSDSKIEITLPDARKSVAIEGSIVADQSYDKVTGNAATISRNSAYTVYYDINDYHTDEYEPLVLSFNAQLPEGTTVILMDKSDARKSFYAVDASGKTSIVLTSFVRMGTEKQAFILESRSYDWQFVVDFSKTESGMAGSSIVTTLVATAQSDSNAETLQKSTTTGLKDASAFTLSITSGETGQVSYKMAASQGEESKWKNCQDALVLSPKQELPSDAYFSIVHKNATMKLYANGNGDFIYTMPEDGDGILTCTLISEQFPPTVTEYEFDVKWMASATKAEKSPMNGEVRASKEMILTGVCTPKISLKVTADKKLYEMNDVVDAKVEWKDLPLDHTLEVVLLAKNDAGEYISTAVTKKINFDSKEGKIDQLQISLAGNREGSYCLQMTAELGVKKVAEAKYYFIVK